MPVVQLSVVRVAQVYGIDPGSAAQVEHEMNRLRRKAAPDIGVINRGAAQGGTIKILEIKVCNSIPYAVLEMMY